MNLNLDEIRTQINDIDDKIADLYEKRLSLCDEVAQYKKSTGKAVLDSRREDRIIERITAGRDKDIKDALTALYKGIFRTSIARQTTYLKNDSPLYTEIAKKAKENNVFPEKANVACQGTHGAYSQIACDALFESPDTLYFENFESVFKSVNFGLCKYGVLPFENSIHGSVCEVYDLLPSFDGYVVRSAKLPIHHSLLCKRGSNLKDIKEIFSHKQAIAQCSDFLNKYRDIKVTVCENTAMAARMVSESGRDDIAAICSESCAEKYNLDILKKDLQNSSMNYTMFYCIAKELEIYSDANKAAFMFNTPNRTGALEDVLALFSTAGINLTKIESKPISGKDFEFMFYAEADISGVNEDMLGLFSLLDATLPFFKFIGIYKEIQVEN